jgi:hypothetical protein
VGLSIQPVLNPLLRELWLDRKTLLLHGAGVRGRSGGSILLLADGGGGKTTTALSMVRRGYRLLGDDLVLVDTEAGEVSMAGIPEPLNITAETMRFFPELAPAAERMGNMPRGTKTMVMPTDAYGADVLVDRCGLRAAYRVKVTPRGPAAQPMDSRTAFGVLVRSHLFAEGQRVTEFAFDRISALLSACPFYELQTGPDPVALGDWLLEHAAGTVR